MFLSMIIDYFTTTKENKEEFQKLSISQFLIYKIESEDLERFYSNLKNAFELHVNQFHSLIDYIAYLVYLNQRIIFKTNKKFYIFSYENYLILPKNLSCLSRLLFFDKNILQNKALIFILFFNLEIEKSIIFINI